MMWVRSLLLIGVLIVGATGTLSAAVHHDVTTAVAHHRYMEGDDASSPVEAAAHRHLEGPARVRYVTTLYHTGDEGQSGSCTFSGGSGLGEVDIRCGGTGGVLQIDELNRVTCTLTGQGTARCVDELTTNFGNEASFEFSCIGTTVENLQASVTLLEGEAECSGEYSFYSRGLTLSIACTYYDDDPSFVQLIVATSDCYATAGSYDSFSGFCQVISSCGYSGGDSSCAETQVLEQIRLDSVGTDFSGCTWPATEKTPPTDIASRSQASYDLTLTVLTTDFVCNLDVTSSVGLLLSCGEGGTILVHESCQIESMGTARCAVDSSISNSMGLTHQISCQGDTTEALSVSARWDPGRMACDWESSSVLSTSLLLLQQCPSKVELYGNYGSMFAKDCLPVRSENSYTVDRNWNGLFDEGVDYVGEQCSLLYGNCLSSNNCDPDNSQALEAIQAIIPSSRVDLDCISPAPSPSSPLSNSDPQPVVEGEGDGSGAPDNPPTFLVLLLAGWPMVWW